MSDTQSLSERLREGVDPYKLQEAEAVMDAAADALDAKDAEIDLLTEGRRLHDELADHFEHKLAQQSALLAQATAALTLVTEWWDEDGPHRAEPDMVSDARQALAAIRKE
jgi:hypothetical protein